MEREKDIWTDKKKAQERTSANEKNENTVGCENKLSLI